VSSRVMSVSSFDPTALRGPSANHAYRPILKTPPGTSTRCAPNCAYVGAIPSGSGDHWNCTTECRMLTAVSTTCRRGAIERNCRKSTRCPDFRTPSRSGSTFASAPSADGHASAPDKFGQGVELANAFMEAPTTGGLCISPVRPHR